MTKKILASFVISTMLFATQAQAVTAELGLFYFTDDLSSTNDFGISRTIYDFAVLMTSQGRQMIGIGWGYAGVSSTEGSTTDTTYSSTETGPKFSYLFGRDQNWYLGFAYNLLAKATFSTGSGEEAEWRGTSMKVEFGYLPKINGRLNAGVKLNYHQASYSEQITNNTTLTQETNTKTMIYPTFAMVWKF
jgi:hypothetical protein